MELKDKLLQLRKEGHLSQQELADQLNVSRQSVSKWELGESQPDINNIISLSEIYHVSTDYLLKDILEESNKTKDMSRPLLYVSTIIVLLGTLTGHMLWVENRNTISLLMGIVIQAIGISVFEIFIIYTKSKNAKSLQKFFFSLNIWLITFLPMRYFMEYTLTYNLLYNQIFQPLTHTTMGLLIYHFFPLLLPLAFSSILFVLIRKFF